MLKCDYIYSRRQPAKRFNPYGILKLNHSSSMKSKASTYSVGLAIPTYGRKKELNRLLSSLSRQSSIPDQIIVIDQNEPGFLDLLISEWGKILPIEHALVAYRSASKARNFGAFKLSTDIIAFPDDDCIFTEKTVEQIRLAFSSNPNCDVIIGHKKPTNDKHRINKKRSRPINTVLGLFRSKAETSNMFCKNTFLQNMPMLFNESIGPGNYTSIISNEETDLLIRMLRENARIIVYPGIQIDHHSSQISLRRSLKYGEGRYELIRRQKLGCLYYLINLLQPLGRLARSPSLDGLKFCAATMLGRSGITRIVSNLANLDHKTTES